MSPKKFFKAKEKFLHCYQYVQENPVSTTVLDETTFEQKIVLFNHICNDQIVNLHCIGKRRTDIPSYNQSKGVVINYWGEGLVNLGEGLRFFGCPFEEG